MFQQNNSKFAIFGGNAFTCLRQNLTYPLGTISLAIDALGVSFNCFKCFETDSVLSPIVCYLKGKNTFIC